MANLIIKDVEPMSEAPNNPGVEVAIENWKVIFLMNNIILNHCHPKVENNPDLLNT